MGTSAPTFGMLASTTSAALEVAAALGEQRLRVAHVLEHVGREHDVERAEIRRQAVVEVGLDEAVDALPHTFVLLDVDARHLVAERADALRRAGRRSSRGRAP